MKEKVDLLKYERKYTALGYDLIAGMDEAGRGPLAGPVTVAACVMNLGDIIDGVNDSKQLTPKKRDVLFDKIVNSAIGYEIVDIDNLRIDEINILNATKEAMRTAIKRLLPIPQMLLVDAVKEEFGIPYEPIIHGDALSYSIAAASVLAKVHRDRLMEKYAEIYPEYGFEKHKGYGTKQHIEALKKYGPCPIHRKTFIKNFFA